MSNLLRLLHTTQTATEPFILRAQVLVKIQWCDTHFWWLQRGETVSKLFWTLTVRIVHQIRTASSMWSIQHWVCKRFPSSAGARSQKCSMKQLLITRSGQSLETGPFTSVEFTLHWLIVVFKCRFFQKKLSFFIFEQIGFAELHVMKDNCIICFFDHWCQPIITIIEINLLYLPGATRRKSNSRKLYLLFSSPKALLENVLLYEIATKCMMKPSQTVREPTMLLKRSTDVFMLFDKAFFGSDRRPFVCRASIPSTLVTFSRLDMYKAPTGLVSEIIVWDNLCCKKA